MTNVIRLPKAKAESVDKWERLHEKHLNELRAFSISDLRRFWDEVGDNSFYEGPEGMFDCADIHWVLNEKGDGQYCAV